MPFPEPLKLEIRRRAHFRCCICRSVGVEIHHIVPQEEDGRDTRANAAPLCPSCHELYGANPTKRKFVREARDFWYELCASSVSVGGLTAQDLSAALDRVASKQDVAELKALLSAPRHQTSHTSKATQSSAEEPAPVPLERFIQSLYEEDFGAIPSLYELLFDAKAWTEDGDASHDMLNRRDLFIREYGEQTARRLCLNACRDTSLDPKGWFTEEQIVNALKIVQTIVVLVTAHEKHSTKREVLVCAQRPDGEFVWRTVSRPIQRRKPSTTARKRESAAKTTGRNAA